MSDNTQFIDGLIIKKPHPNAPDFVLLKLSIKREELIQWLERQSGEWINADVKESRAGKVYAAIDNWEPKQQSPQQSAPSGDDSSIPF
jgi:lipopolysaccharide export LptBFGC system permease protein LptF